MRHGAKVKTSVVREEFVADTEHLKREYYTSSNIHVLVSERALESRCFKTLSTS